MEIQVSPASVGQLLSPWLLPPALALHAEGMGHVGLQAATSQGFTAFPEAPVWPVGALLLTAAGNIWNSNIHN